MHPGQISCVDFDPYQSGGSLQRVATLFQDGYAIAHSPSLVSRLWIAPAWFQCACRDGGGGQPEMITAAKVHPLCSKSRDRGRAESQTHYIGAPEHYARQNAVTAKREKRHNRPACTLPRPLGLASQDSVVGYVATDCGTVHVRYFAAQSFSLVHAGGGEHFRIMTRAAAPKSWRPWARRLHRDKTREEASSGGCGSRPLPV